MAPTTTRRSPVRAFYVALIGNIDPDPLTEREWDVLTRRWVDGESLDDVGGVYNVSRERVRQIEAKSFAKLRAYAIRRGRGQV